MRKEIIGNCTLYCGDCLDILPTLGKVDALITDPPYCSGGLSTASRIKGTGKKYMNVKGELKTGVELPDFEKYSLDQRLWMRFMSEVLKIAKPRISAEGLYAFFIDWRQLPALQDMLMLGGYIIRGVAVWDKKNCRPQPYSFRQQAEFIVWGRRKSPASEAEAVYSPGVFRVENEMCSSGYERYHQTQKPVSLMKRLLEQTKRGGVIVDPFMGSGTTGVACVEMGRRFIGIELNERYFDIACKRIEQDCVQGRLFDTVEAG